MSRVKNLRDLWKSVGHRVYDRPLSSAAHLTLDELIRDRDGGDSTDCPGRIIDESCSTDASSGACCSFPCFQPLWAQDRPTAVNQSEMGAPYPVGISTNRPARIVKIGSNAAWLTVARNRILTGKPSPDSPQKSTIEVRAHAHPGSSPVIRIQCNNESSHARVVTVGSLHWNLLRNLGPASHQPNWVLAVCRPVSDLVGNLSYVHAACAQRIVAL